jgi:Uracil DNA glycosylase superfamily
MLEPINQYVEALRRTHGRDIPVIDQMFGRAEAPVLLVLRQPGPKGATKTGRLSLENPDKAAGALALRLKEAGLSPSDVAVWNIIPWIPQGPLKSPTDQELQLGVRCLQDLLPLLSKRRLAVVLMGGPARKARKRVNWPEWVRVFESPSPAPPEGTKPEPKAQIVRTLKEAYAWATEPVQPTQPVVSTPREIPVAVAHGSSELQPQSSTAPQAGSLWTLLVQRVSRISRTVSDRLSGVTAKISKRR